MLFFWHDKFFTYDLINYESHPRELSSLDRDIAYYMQGPEFEPQTPHISTFKMCEL